MMRARIKWSLLLIATSATTIVAQVPNASAAATGLAGAYIARARGYDAVAWNPANLGMPNSPDFSLGLFAVSASLGLTPISLADIAPFSGKPLPATTRNQWLQAVVANGNESGNVDGGVTLVGFSTGSFAFSLSGLVAGSTNLAPDAFQALLFGNAGLTGTPSDLDLRGSMLHMGAFTTAAGSYGFGFGGPANHFALGVTGKVVVGNALAMAQDQGSTSTSAGINVDFPTVFSRPRNDVVAGSGAGLDAGLAWSLGRLTFGATVQNVVNTFAWDENKLHSRTALAVFDASTDSASFVDLPYANAPASLRALVANDKFKPVLSAGMAYDLSRSLTFSADARQRSNDGIVVGPKTQVAGGLEFRGIPRLTLRGGAAYVTDGWGASGGVSLSLGSVELGGGAMLRQVNGVRQPEFTVNVLSFR
jgi:hypothetical protein